MIAVIVKCDRTKSNQSFKIVEVFDIHNFLYDLQYINWDIDNFTDVNNA